MKQAIVAIEDRRFYTNSGDDLRGIARAPSRTSPPSWRGAGRLDDHAAVRQERARRPERPHAVREAARGRARLPPHAQVVQGADPAQLPEHDLLRQRRLRDRVGRADLLRRDHHGCGERTRRARCASLLEPHEAALLAAWSPRRPGSTRSSTPRRRAPARRRAAADARAGLPHAPQYDDAASQSPAHARGPPSRARTRSTRTSPPGSSSRSSTSSAAASSAPGAPSRAA